ncbi:MAG: HAMP domain-containing histidine kinase [Gammaproteobacteria bacterium]|uniref:sensor histidine kinase n=1 Tax=Rhodoferax sp. TaxID=50421 RepID=UPI001848BCFA|nr:HAMP domain-containing sensor histidine kinase [Rhodoferax sp.]MBU3899634.1 HAMP domain-containing histidine kinase [Gammaproteobacteria bacterium]MBA3056566.1 HAMP domain-containing histidine kinase [Rhodoferax sp.]MBU3998965.1 HAMP domain-containing histidine kinase [Gammaproteobacteria bacterium]MBU4018110.1 HAMP domain-containing histidine kinase [Gammaproteobacteria bacterium]MBU4080199.1 HAMP domain-containing histidine kinase [Gammaproteobacteria bacterium]
MLPTANPEESPERDLTDASLREEREKADREMTANRVATEKNADAVVEHARENADAVLVAAREKADKTTDAAAPNDVQNAVAEDREVEDAKLRDERAAADMTVRRERDARAHLLTRLLPLERDATDQYLLTERAGSDDALATRDDFLGMVAHDLRDLLNGIVVSSQFLSQKLEKHSDREQLLLETTRIERYGARMNRLIGDLVDVASIDAGKLAMHTSQGDVALLVVEAVEALQITASARGVSLAVQNVQDHCLAEFDHDRMLQVLANLIANSIKFTPKGGSILVHCQRVGESIEFCVDDTGEGIPAAMIEAVFERFWQVGKSDRRGLGLGLYISRCIVEAHGGNIRAESSPGQGTRMLFTLPISAEQTP